MGLYQKEMRSLFNTPLAYALILGVLLTPGILFLNVFHFLAQGQATLRGYLGWFPLILAVVIPLLTQRAWSEDRRNGRDEILNTLPVSSLSLVFAKFLALMTFLSLVFALTLPMTLMALPLGHFEPAEIWGEYLGLFFLTSSSLSLCLFFSSRVKTAFAGFFFNVLFLSILYLSDMFLQSVSWGEALANFISFFSFSFRFSHFQRGVIDSRDVLFFLVVTIAGLKASAHFHLTDKWGRKS